MKVKLNWYFFHIFFTGLKISFRLLFPSYVLLLYAVGLFLPCFGFRRCKRKLYLALQRRDLRFQRLQLVLLLPYAADRFLNACGRQCSPMKELHNTDVLVSFLRETAG